jgi:hypothetical protein
LPPIQKYPGPGDGAMTSLRGGGGAMFTVTSAGGAYTGSGGGGAYTGAGAPDQ